jgi:hypothetical protein
LTQRLYAQLEVAFLVSLRALLEGDRAESLHALHRAVDELTDPEATFCAARTYARLAASEDALASLRKVVDGGNVCYPAFANDPWFDSVRELAPFEQILETARARHNAARQAFTDAAGTAILSCGF